MEIYTFTSSTNECKQNKVGVLFPPVLGSGDRRGFPALDPAEKSQGSWVREVAHEAQAPRRPQDTFPSSRSLL